MTRPTSAKGARRPWTALNISLCPRRIRSLVLDLQRHVDVQRSQHAKHQGQIYPLLAALDAGKPWLADCGHAGELVLTVFSVPSGIRDQARTGRRRSDRADQGRETHRPGDSGRPVRRGVLQAPRGPGSSGLGGLDIVVNNAGRQQTKASILDISSEEFDATIKTNIYAPVWIIKAARPHLRPGSSIFGTTSEQAYDPSAELYDYAQTKAATMNYAQSLAKQLGPKAIRVNGVAPGPIWTPL